MVLESHDVEAADVGNFRNEQEDIEENCRKIKYREVAIQKRRRDLHHLTLQEEYYSSLISMFHERKDIAADRDKKQLEKDLPRTFQALPPVHCAGGCEALLPLVGRVTAAYIERGRRLSVASRNHCRLESTSASGRARAPTTARGLLDGYPQGLNFLVGMSLVCAGGASWDGNRPGAIEEIAFWLLALLLEDVLDPDFFGAADRLNRQMAYIGGLGMKSIVVDRSAQKCTAVFEALGDEAFENCVGPVLDKWLLSMFIGCAPHRLMYVFWEHLLLPSPYNDEECECPRGLCAVIAFALAGLECCAERELANTQLLQDVRAMRLDGAEPQMLMLEFSEAIMRINKSFAEWPQNRDQEFVESFTRHLSDITSGGADKLWEEVQRRKQRIVGLAEGFDLQLMALAERTHFTVQEVGRLKRELENYQNRRNAKSSVTGSVSNDGLTFDTFRKVTKKIVPEFPIELCGRLFAKLDAFNVGRLAFAELACGMSALSLGTVDEKLQVCFDLFDSEGRRALSLNDLIQLCNVLFRLALARGSSDMKKAQTDEVLIPNPKSARTLLHSPLLRRRPLDSTGTFFAEVGRFGSGPDEDNTPRRNMLLRLLTAAKKRESGGPWLVAFEDFRLAASTEPAILCLFSWCLPRPPDVVVQSFIDDSSDRTSVCFICKVCQRLALWGKLLFGSRADRHSNSSQHAA